MSRHNKKAACITNKALGSIISDVRQEQSITLKQFAKTLRITHRQLEKYESGEDLVPIKMLEFIGDSLGYRVHKKLVRQIMKVRNMDENEREQYHEYLISLYKEAFEVEKG